MDQRNVQRAELTLGDAASLYACCGLFDLCTDPNLMQLNVEGNRLMGASLAGSSKFLDWLTWRTTLECEIRKAFITTVRPENCSEGYVCDPCSDPNGIEWGVCEFLLRDFARLRRQGPTRDVTTNRMIKCAAQPRYRLDGTIITNERELDAVMATEVVVQDLKRMIIDGNASTIGQFNGLQQLIKTNYTDPSGRSCSSMDSLILNWNGNTLDGGAGITWNGRAVGATYSFVDVLLAVFRHILQDIQMAPTLAAQAPRVGDFVLAMPTFLTRCLLDAYTCWSVCPSATLWNNPEARQFREQLNGGMFGAGRIYLDGWEIPLIGYDWGLINGPTTGDIYLLTGSVGNVRVLEGQMLDMSTVPSDFPAGNYMGTDNGKLLHWQQFDHTCYKHVVEMRPRLLCWAPWAQARFEDVVCATPGLPKSPDPCSSYFPETSFSAAACAEPLAPCP